jgi:hypothetical protein
MAISTVLSSNTFNQFRVITNEVIANVNSQYDGTANLILRSANSATINVTTLTVYGDAAIQGGDITTNSASFTLANTTATTLSVGGAATSVLIGATTGNTNIRSANTVLSGDLFVNGGEIRSTNTVFNVANATTTTLGIGGAATSLLLGATTGNTNIRSSNTVLAGDLFVNGGDIVSTNTIFTVANNTVTTLELGGAANVNIGSATGNTNIRSANTIVSELFVTGGDIYATTSAFTVANTVATSVRLGGAATDLMLGATTGTATIRNASTVITGDLTVSGGDIVGTASLNLANTVTTSLEIGGAANVNIGSTTGNTTIRSANTILTGDLFVNGGDIVSTQATFNIANTTATTLELGGAASVNIGSTTGNTTIRSANTVLTGNLIVNGGNTTFTSTNITVTGNTTIGGDLAVNGGDVTTNQTTFTVANTTATSVRVGGAATDLMLGATTGTATIRNASTVLVGDLNVNGGDIGTTATTFTVANTTATTVWLGGGATSNVIVGATTGNTTLRSADTTVDGKLSVKGITDINVNTATNALRVTQQGTGNALVIQDTFSDTSPIVVDQLGRLVMGGTEVQSTWYASSRTPTHFITGNGGNGDGLGILTYGSTPIILMGLHGSNTLNTRGTVSNGDVLGSIDFVGDDNIAASLIKGAVLQVFVDSPVDTPNTASLPSTFQIRTKTANVSTPGITASFDSSGATTLTGNLAVGGNVLSTSNTQFAIANSTATTLSVGGAATSLLIGATTGTTTIRNASTVITGDLTVSGGDIVGTASLNLANTTSTTLNIGGAATTLNIGSTTGNTTIRNAGTVIAGDLFVQGGDIVGTTAALNLANSTTTTLNIGGSANVITVGAANSGTFTINNNKAIINSTGALRVPVGNTIQRGTASQGDVRYNTQLTAYEGYDGANWSSLGGVKSVDGLTFIIAETSPGASDDTLHFYTANGATSYEVAQMNATKFAILQTTEASSATTGALTVAGGVGINGKLYVNGASTVSANFTVTGNTAINGGGLTTTNTIFTVANTTATTLELGGAANVNIGSTTGNTTIRSANTIITGNTIIAGNLTVNGNTTIINSTTLSIDDKNIILADGAADNSAANGAGITIAGSNANVVYLSASDSFDINKSIITPGDIAVNGGDITTTSATFNVANTTATSVRVGGAATDLMLGATTGTATIRNPSTVLVGDLAVNGGDITTSSATFNVANATATTVNIGGGATLVSVGATTGATSIRNNLSIGNTSPVAKFQINTQDGFRFDASGSNTTMRFGSALTGESTGELRFERASGQIVISSGSSGSALTDLARFSASGDFGIGNIPSGTYKLEVTGSIGASANVAVNGGGITTTNTIFTVANTTATTVNIGGAANVNIGSTTGNTVIRSANTVLTGDLFVNGGDILSTQATLNIANTTATTLSVGGAATTLLLGATTGTATIRNASTVIVGDLTVSGGDIISTTASLNLANTTATTVELGGAATTLNMGAATGTANIRNATVNLLGSALTAPATFSLANTTTTALGIAGAATNLMIGATTGTATIRNASTVLVGDLNVNGGDIGTTATTFTVANTTATTLWLGAGATSNVLIGATTGNTFIRSANTIVNGNFTANGTITETANGQQWAVASQYDIGMNPNQIPLNQYLGSMAFQSADAISVGAATVSGDLAVNSGNVITTSTTFNVANTTATSVSVGGAATSVLIGATTGNTNVRSANTIVNELFVTGGDIYTTTSAFTVANTVATTLSVGGAATDLMLGATTGTTTIRNASTVLVGNLAVNGGDITTSSTTFNVANTTATSVRLGGAATDLMLGATTGTATIRNATVNLLGSALTAPATFSLANTTTTTLGIAGAATNLVIGATTGIATIRNATVALSGSELTAPATFAIANTVTTSLEIGGAANVNIGSATGNSTIRSANTVLTGDLFVNGGDILSTQGTFNVANTTATSVRVGGAATDLMLGATTGTATIRNATLALSGSALTAPATFALANTTTTTLGIAGAATNLVIGATTGTATIRNATTVITGDLTVSGGDIVGTASLNLANTTTTALELGGAATTLNMGATTGTATIRNATVNMLGSALTAPATFALANTTTTTLTVGGAATNLMIGATTGTATIRNATLALSGSALTAPATFALANSVTTSLEIGGAANVNIGSTTGNTTIRSANTVVGKLFVTGGDIYTTTAAFTVANTVATSVSVGGAATDLMLGATTGTATIRNSTVNLLGSALTAPATFSLANTSTTTLGIAGDANNIVIGATTGTATIRNASTVLVGDLNVNGGDINTTSSTFTVANTTATTIELGGAATTLNMGATTGTATIRNANVVITGSLSARYTTKSISAASASSVTPDISAYNQYSYTALAAGLTIEAPTGTPVDGDRLMFRIKDNGTSRAITWNAIYRIVGTVLPIATVANKTSYVGCIYNAADTKWDVVAVSREA